MSIAKKWKIALAALCVGAMVMGSAASTAHAGDYFVYGGGGGGGGGAEAVVANGGAAGAGLQQNAPGGGGETGENGTTEGGTAGGNGGAPGGTSSGTATGGSGGVNGANALEIVSTETSGNYGTLTLIAGDGGSGGDVANANNTTAGNGGNGGGVRYSATGDVTVTTALNITAGSGGTDGSNNGGSGTAGTAGAGGTATFASSAALVLDGGTATLASGTLNDATTGSSVVFSVGALKAGAGNGTFTANAAGAGTGSYSVAIGSIEAIDGNMTLDFTNRTASEVAITGDITVGAGKTFGVTGTMGTNFAWTGTNLNTTDQVTVNGLNLDNKTVNVSLTDSFAITGGAILQGNTTTFVTDNTTISITATEAARQELLNYNAGDAIIGGTIDTTGITAGLDIEVTSGAYKGVLAIDNSGDFATLAFSGMTLDQGIAHNALMSASALSMLLTGGSDIVSDMTAKFTPYSGQGFGDADMPGTQWGGFGYIGGGRFRADTNSHVKSNNFHLLVGTGLRFNHGCGSKTDVGVFFESGWGNFDTYNSFYRGDGDSEYYGGGLLLRHDTNFGLYGEASFRAGYAKSEYDSRYDTDYDLKSMYYGGHVGLGYIFRPSDVHSFDLFAKGLWTHLNDDSDVNKAGQTMKVDDTDSLRTQLGVRYNYNLSCNVTAYAKAAWEYEFDGETKGWYNGQKIRKTDMGGSSGLGELGVDWRVSERATVGAAVHGVVGKRRGVGGNVNVSFGF